MRILHPWERCHSCGKHLEDGNGYLLSESEKPDYIHVVQRCTNPRCKKFKKVEEHDVPILSRGGWLSTHGPGGN